MTRGGRVSGVLLSSNGSRIIVTTKVDGINGGRGVGKVYQDEDQAPFGRTWYYGGAEGLQVRWVGWLLCYIFFCCCKGFGGQCAFPLIWINKVFSHPLYMSFFPYLPVYAPLRLPPPYALKLFVSLLSMYQQDVVGNMSREGGLGFGKYGGSKWVITSYFDGSRHDIAQFFWGGGYSFCRGF